jgi:hypothetical protein
MNTASVLFLTLTGKMNSPSFTLISFTKKFVPLSVTSVVPSGDTSSGEASNNSGLMMTSIGKMFENERPKSLEIHIPNHPSSEITMQTFTQLNWCSS